MWERIFTILRKEFRSVFRDPRMRMVIFGVPVLQTLIFGYAVTMDVRHVRLVVVDRDGTPDSRALVARFEGSEYFAIVARTNDENRARALIDGAEASAVLQINAGFAADLPTAFFRHALADDIQAKLLSDLRAAGFFG